MEIKEAKVIDMLTKDSVSIITRKFIDLDGVKTQVGLDSRCAYVNSEKERVKISEEQPYEVVNSVFAIWGDTATVEEQIPE